MPRVFFRCLICGKDGEGHVVPDEPPTRPLAGWVVFLGVYWPPGVDVGPLVLRLCGRCFLEQLVKTRA
jgi:hypothetical protein